MVEEFAHDVFVSYASEDHSWAQDFKDLLGASGSANRIFFDRESLRAGDVWEAKIEAGLKSSRHLIVLWSSSSRDSSWVSREMATFWVHAKPADNADRRMIIVNMDTAKSAAYQRVQHISSQELKAAYVERRGDLPGVWDEAMRAVVKGLNPDAPPLQVPIVVLTLTREQLEDLQPDRKTWVPEFGVSQADIAAQYGLTRDEWRPLAGRVSINTLLTDMKSEIERGLVGRPVTWREPDAELWDSKNTSDWSKFASEVFEKSELSVLVIDPIAICHPDIFQRLMCFQESFARPQTVVVVLPPFGVPLLTKLRQALLNRGTPCFNAYFAPVFPPGRRQLAQYLWNASDADDMRRHLLAAASALVAEHKAPERSPYLRQGGGR